MRKSSLLLGDNIPFVQAAHIDGKQRPSSVLLHTSWTTGRAGAANGIAQAWHNPNNRKDSSHYVIDQSTILRCVPDKVSSIRTAGEYKGAISINVCYDPPEIPNLETVERAARLTARLCTLYHLPVRILDEDQEAKWLQHKWRRRGGIILKTAGVFSAADFLLDVKLYSTNY